MDNVKKLYIKALNKYEKGYIDKAIDICEQIMSLDIKNSAAINLKGLLCYFKGDLESSRALWKLNYEVNDDEVSRKYLQSLKEDEERFSMYIHAIRLMEDLKFKDSLNMLMQCKESDYNCINVDNAIATCYIKLGNNKKALLYINRVLKLDKKNQIAIKSKKNILKTKANLKKVLKIGSLMILLIASIASIKIIKVYKNNKIPVDAKKVSVDKKSLEKKVSKSKDNPNKKPKKEVKKKEVFPYENINKSLLNKDFNALYIYTNAWKNKELSINNKVLINKSESLLKNEGVKYFYNNAMEYLKDNKELYKAIDNLEKAYAFGKESYLYDEIIFMLGKSYESKKDIEKAIKYYEEYDSKFSKEGYSEGVLYKLATLYKDIDPNKSKVYGQKLIKNYPNGEYINSIIKSIVNE